MKARIFCHDAPEFPAPPGNTSTTLSSSSISARPTPSGHPHHPHHPGPHHSWAHCEILPDKPFHHGPPGKRDFAGAVGLGMLLGFLLCAIPLFVLLRKVRRLKRTGMHGHGGGHHPGGRWKLKQHGPPPHGPHHAFPEYEAEHLFKQEYEAPLVSVLSSRSSFKGLIPLSGLLESTFLRTR
jgi:hypothetical protein